LPADVELGQPKRHVGHLAFMRAILLTALCVIVSALLVTLMAEGPQLGLFKPALAAMVDS
jgi:hypothetical protein